MYKITSHDTSDTEIFIFILSYTFFIKKQITCTALFHKYTMNRARFMVGSRIPLAVALQIAQLVFIITTGSRAYMYLQFQGTELARIKLKVTCAVNVTSQTI